MYEQLSLLDKPKNTEVQVEQVISAPDGDVLIIPHFFSQEESDSLFATLYEEIQWRQDFIKMYGKSIPLPRLTAWYGDANKSYTYSKIQMNSTPWTDSLLKIKSRIENLAEASFNSVLINLYRDGKDGVAWHSDDETELGNMPVIASVSFGGTRRFVLKHKHNKELNKVDIKLSHGSLLVMKGNTQEDWQHQVPKTVKEVSRRINLTYRKIN
ncbi:MAG: alpha-ketoglutarate-dependent dioxygenase AlkB [Spirulinaceae cyanobacterium]